MPSRLKEFATNENIDLNIRVYVFEILITCEILFVAFLVRLLISGFSLNTATVLVTFILISLIGFITVRSKKVELGAIIICILLGVLFFPAIFIIGGGIMGDAPIWFLYILIIVNIGLKTNNMKKLFTAILALVGIFVYFVGAFIPYNMVEFTNFEAYLISFTTLILVGFNTAFILTTQHNLIERERQISEEKNKEIECLVASQNRFFSSMSHEIRTPINTIIGLNEMILREDISDEIAEDAVNIRAASKMLLNTINDILDMSKFQAGDMRVLVEPYNTGSMLSEIVGMLWLRAKEKNLDFHINVAPDIPTELRGDEVRIKQILMNILNNAIKYTKEGSISLSVECEKKDDGLVNMIYTVEDTGMGIKKEDIPYLFTAFKRVDETNTKHIEGTGLGLSIVKQFLDLMGGKVTVNSVYTKGSTFIIEIPQKANSDKELGEYDYEKKHRVHNRSSYNHKFEAPDAKLLVVDDNEANLLVVTKLLRDTKIQIDTAKNGVEALEKTLDKEYNLIFMDHLMPEMDGVECFRNIRNQVGGKNKETSIVVLTANAGEENRVIYAREGFNGYVVKPVTGNDLENEVFRQLPQTLIRVIDSSGLETGDAFSMMQESQRKRRIAITTESTCNLTQELLDKYRITVINHKVKTSEGMFREGIDIDTTGLMEYMADPNNKVVTRSPKPDDYERFFAENLTTANNIIHITMSSDMEHHPYKYAMEAAESFDNVTVFDSRHMGSGQGLVAIFACRMIEAGMGVEEVVLRLGKLKERIKNSIMIDNMDYLARAGFVSTNYAGFMKSLMLRPFSYTKNGKIEMAGMLFGSSERVWKRFVHKALMYNNLSDEVVFVNYVGLSKKDLDYIKSLIEEKHNFKKIYFVQTNPVVATSFGPGAFSITVVNDE